MRGCPSAFTSSHAAPPAKASAAAKRKEVAHPKRCAIHGVKEELIAPPSWQPMFITPETDPAEAPPMSALTDQNELCEIYNAPAPPASTMTARATLPTSAPAARK